MMNVKDASIRDSRTLAKKVKLSVGVYILQTNRAKFNSAEVSGICVLYSEEDETLKHFILNCQILDYVRSQIIKDIDGILINLLKKKISEFTVYNQLRIIVDCSYLKSEFFIRIRDINQLVFLEHHTRRLCFILHTERQKYLNTNIKRRCKGCYT